MIVLSRPSCTSPERGIAKLAFSRRRWEKVATACKLALQARKPGRMRAYFEHLYPRPAALTRPSGTLSHAMHGRGLPIRSAESMILSLTLTYPTSHSRRGPLSSPASGRGRLGGLS